MGAEDPGPSHPGVSDADAYAGERVVGRDSPAVHRDEHRDAQESMEGLLVISEATLDRAAREAQLAVWGFCNKKPSPFFRHVARRTLEAALLDEKPG